MTRQAFAVDFRDADGWISTPKLAELFGRSAQASGRIVRHRAPDAERASRRYAGTWKKRLHFRFSDAEWEAVCDYADELRFTAFAKQKGWNKSDATDEDGTTPIRLWFKLDFCGYPIAWQWREDTAEQASAPAVLTMREAMDQLLGRHPVRLIFQTRRGPLQDDGDE